MAAATMSPELGLTLHRIARTVVGGYVRRHPTVGWQWQELLSDAMLGAVQAAERWDGERSDDLEGWVGRRAHGAVIDGLRDRAPLARAQHHAGLTIEDLPPQLQPARSLDAMSEDLGREPALDHNDTEAPYRMVEVRDQLERLLRAVSDRERYVVLSLAYGVRPGELAAEFAVSEARIFQIRRRAFEKIRDAEATRAGAAIPDPGLSIYDA